MLRTHRRKWGGSPQGFCLRVPKCVFFLSPIQPGLSATYPAPILTIFETKDVNWCPHAYISEKLPNFCTGFSRSQKQLKMGTFKGGACELLTAQTAQFRVMGIISGVS